MTNTKAVETDTKLAELHQELAQAERRVESIYESIHYLVDTKTWKYGEQRWNLTNGGALIALFEALENETIVAYQVDKAKALPVALKAANKVVKGILAEIAKLDAIFDAAPWSRFFIVQNNNGHIHSNLRCSTTYASTRWGWNPELSGQTEAEAVEALGEILCTVCYPSAPVAWTNGVSRKDSAAKAERAAAKAERDAAKAAKGITNEDGSPLRGEWGIIKTARAAQIELVGHIANHTSYGYKLNETLVATLSAALKAKGMTQAEIDAKVAAKIKRDAR